MILRTIESQRMMLVAASIELVDADLSGHDELAQLIDATVPDNWPPDLYERQAMQYAREQLSDAPGQVGWSFWYLLTRPPENRELLGICGFKGFPDQQGTVEIGYSVLHQNRCMGYATEAMGRLISWAFAHHNVMKVCAETLPHLRQSIRVMEKNGLHFVGPGSEHGVIRYAVQRTELR